MPVAKVGRSQIFSNTIAGKATRWSFCGYWFAVRSSAQSDLLAVLMFKVLVLFGNTIVLLAAPPIGYGYFSAFDKAAAV